MVVFQTNSTESNNISTRAGEKVGSSGKMGEKHSFGCGGDSNLKLSVLKECSFFVNINAY